MDTYRIAILCKSVLSCIKKNMLLKQKRPEKDDFEGEKNDFMQAFFIYIFISMFLKQESPGMKIFGKKNLHF